MKSRIIKKEFFDPNIQSNLKVILKYELNNITKNPEKYDLVVNILHNDFNKFSNTKIDNTCFYYGDELFLNTKLKYDSLFIYKYRLKDYLRFLHTSIINTYSITENGQNIVHYYL